ncbi:MAG: alpha/beta hydrolase [Gammaproteobacteria bacterium]|nr:alpha/beta hydrolase [Gammaproteobacteria bacterium]
MKIKSKIHFIAILLLQLSSHAVSSEPIDGHRFLPPGRLVDVDGFRLHINCIGEGEPTVVFDSGTGGFSLEWARIQNAVSKHTRVCTYDRAGYGWSDMGPLPRTSKRIVNELHSLLLKAMIPGPYILAGHSFGGFTAQYFARLYPEETAALVLIDSSHPEQVDRLPKASRGSTRIYPAKSRTYSVSRVVLHEHYPQENGMLAYKLMSSWKYRFTLQQEMLSLPQSAKEILALEPLQTMPLVVLTRGKRVWPNSGFGNKMEKTWMELQDELSLLSLDVVHLVAERSGHSIHLDQPGLVISALDVLLNTEKRK